MIYGIPLSGYFDDGHSYIDFLDFGVCGSDIGFSCHEAPKEGLQKYFLSLSATLRAAWDATKIGVDYNIGVVPMGAGFNTYDHNGIYRIGVRVNETLHVTPLGSTVPLKVGDEVLLFNNNPVFNRDDLSIYLLNHARKNGYNVKYRVIFRRNGEVFEGFGHTFFDRNVYTRNFLNPDGSCKFKELAFLVSALEEACFYTQSTLTCIKRNLLGEIGLDAECKFERDQIIAALQQFCGGESLAGTILGGIYMPLRAPAESILRRIPGLSGADLFKSLGRTGILEGIEEASRTALTLPPGFDINDSLSQIQRNASIGSAIGIGFQIATRGVRPRRFK